MDSRRLTTYIGSMTDGSITVVPSVHFSPRHRRRVRETIRASEPDLVAVELGERRYDRLERSQQGLDLSGMSPPAAVSYQLLRAIQRTVVRLSGLDPETSDMETAVETAAEVGVDVALIDDPIDETVTALASAVGPLTFPRSVARAYTLSPAEQLERLELIGLPFEEIQDGDDVEPLVEHVRDLFPELAEVLVDRRDRSMAERLDSLRREGYDVVAVVGAAHHNGLERELNVLGAGEYGPETAVPIVTPSMDVARIPLD